MDFVKQNKVVLGALALMFVLHFMKQKTARCAQQPDGILCDKPSWNGLQVEVPVTHLQRYPSEVKMEDGYPELALKFIGTAKGVPNRLLRAGDEFRHPVDLAKEMELDSLKATYGSVAFDFDKNGYNDLIVAMEDGVWFCKNNLVGGKPFSQKLIMAKQPGLTPTSITINDFDKDGNTDLYIRQIYDGKNQAGPSAILRYSGPYEFVDVTSVVSPQKLKVLERPGPAYHYQSDNGMALDYPFVVVMPNTLEFANAMVTVVSGQRNLIKFNTVGTGQVQNSHLIFDVSPTHIVDKVKIRTMYGKEYNYSEQNLRKNNILKVEPGVHFETSRNLWRASSMG